MASSSSNGLGVARDDEEEEELSSPSGLMVDMRDYYFFEVKIVGGKEYAFWGRQKSS